jgi:ribosomal protein S18 acetylase RimI-like enzyme
MIRLATEEDLDFLVEHDRHLTRSAMLDKVRRDEVYLVVQESEPIGWARYNLFWDLVPFLTNIHILQNHRRRGFGTQLIRHWEGQMKGQGFTFVLTSTQADEDAQFFYRKVGYADSGSILFPGQAATEIVLLKHLGAAERKFGADTKSPPDRA